MLQELHFPPAIVGEAFQQLLLVLKDGRRHLCWDDMIWFANFPPGEATAEYDALQAKAIEYLGPFLTLMAQTYPILRQQALQHQIPILAFQGYECLRCVSPVLSILIFKESCLALGCPAGKTLLNMVSLCRQDIAYESQMGGHKEAIANYRQESFNRYRRLMAWIHSPPEPPISHAQSQLQHTRFPPPTPHPVDELPQRSNVIAEAELQLPRHVEIEQQPIPMAPRGVQRDNGSSDPKQEAIEEPMMQVDTHPGQSLRTPRPNVEDDYHESTMDFAVSPAIVLFKDRFWKNSFVVTDEEFSLLVSSKCNEGISYFENSRRYRLRIVEVDGDTASTANGIGEAKWGSAKPAQLQGLSVSINGQHMVQSPPYELNPYIRQGINTVEISMRHVGESTCFGVAVEVIVASSHQHIIDTISKAPPFSMDETLALIGLLCQTNGTHFPVRVSVVDQQTSKLVRAAVRSAHCQHIECFDLDDWLERRLFMAPATSGPYRLSTADDWLCPICNAAAPPSCLRLDDFFHGVGDKLWKLGQETKEIMLRADGSWSAVENAPRAAASHAPSI